MVLKLTSNRKRLYRIPNITAWIFPRRIWFGKSQNVYLTFDDGPHSYITPKLLDFLKQHNIKATFFWLGENIQKHPELLERAINEGHQVGHHGFQHLLSTDLSDEEFIKNYSNSKKMVSSNLFRPPYGRIKKKQARFIEKQGDKIVMWSLMPYDFDQDLSTDEVISIIRENLKEKDIIVLHENDKTTDRWEIILEETIKIVKERGLGFEKL